jgi:hypothetical protein
VTAWAKRRRGPAAITLAFLVLGMMNLILVPPFVPRDESSHVTYALAIADGRFPRIDDTNPANAIPGLQPFKTWTANHPPLFYVLGAVPLKAGEAIGEPVLGLRGMRLLNLLFGAVAVYLAGSLGALLLPLRPEAPTLAAAGLALAGSVANNLAVAYNDGLGLAAAIAILVVGLRILREGPSRRLLVALALLAAVGGLARFTVFMAIGFGALLAAAGVYLDRPARRSACRSRRPASRRAGGTSATAASTARSPARASSSRCRAAARTPATSSCSRHPGSGARCTPTSGAPSCAPGRSPAGRARFPRRRR